ADRPRSTLLVGEPGVGKTAIARALAARLGRAGWTVFQAGAAELLAGQVYIGEFEKRMQEVLRHLSRPRRVLWVIPDFPALALAGRRPRHRRGHPRGGAARAAVLRTQGDARQRPRAPSGHAREADGGRVRRWRPGGRAVRPDRRRRSDRHAVTDDRSAGPHPG